jgi:hypothetical protein
MTDSQREHLAKVADTLQLVVIAMAVGVVMLGAVAVALREQGVGQPGDVFFTYLSAGIAFIALVVALMVQALFGGRARRKLIAGESVRAVSMLGKPLYPDELGDVGLLAAVYQTRLIFAAGILEGAAIVNLADHMMAGHAINLIAAAVMLLALLSLFPTCSRLEEWIENQLTVIAQLREMQTGNAR